MLQFELVPPIDGHAFIDLPLDEPLGEGANAKVYRVSIGGKFYAAKIYNSSDSFEAEKLDYMVKHIPQDLGVIDGRYNYPRYAWPLAVIKGSEPQKNPAGVGFIMPLIDRELAKTLEYFFDHNLSKRLSSKVSNVLSFKIEILKNLADLIDGLHRDGHKFVDLKPQNIGVYEGTNIVTLLDCDGFWIRNNEKGIDYKSSMVSPDYIAPEIFRSDLSSTIIDKSQDEYAFAVIVFQMLNNGIHPFQGLIIDKTIDISQNDEAASYGLYAYGFAPSLRILPKAESLHHCFLDETRNLFDRAFTSVNRPTLGEWSEHFSRILQMKMLVRCDDYPQDPTHIHFRDKPCQACLFSDTGKASVQMSSSIKSFADIAGEYIEANPPIVPKNGNEVLATLKSLAAAFVVAGVIVGALQFILSRSSKEGPAPPSAPAQPSNKVQLSFCNKTKNPVWIAISYSIANSQYVKGWFKYAPSECAFVADFQRENLFWYAYSNTGAEWAGKSNSQAWCVNKTDRFEFIARQQCRGGEVLTNFHKLNVQSKEYTMNLTE